MGPVKDVLRDADKGKPMTSRPTKPLPPIPAEPEQRRKPQPLQAPRGRSTWEPVPLHAPTPEPRPASRPSRNEEAPRGVVIINYGDDDS